MLQAFELFCCFLCVQKADLVPTYRFLKSIEKIINSNHNQDRIDLFLEENLKKAIRITVLYMKRREKSNPPKELQLIN